MTLHDRRIVPIMPEEFRKGETVAGRRRRTPRPKAAEASEASIRRTVFCPVSVRVFPNM